jgi:stage V sporulation protein R
VRESLSHQYDLGSREPNIQVWNVNLRGDRSLTLRHFQHNDRPLHDSGAGSAEARGPAVGLRRAPGKRQRPGDVTKRWTVPAPGTFSAGDVSL